MPAAIQMISCSQHMILWNRSVPIQLCAWSSFTGCAYTSGKHKVDFEIWSVPRCKTSSSVPKSWTHASLLQFLPARIQLLLPIMKMLSVCARTCFLWLQKHRFPDFFQNWKRILLERHTFFTIFWFPAGMTYFHLKALEVRVVLVTWIYIWTARFHNVAVHVFGRLSFLWTQRANPSSILPWSAIRDSQKLELRDVFVRLLIKVHHNG